MNESSAISKINSHSSVEKQQRHLQILIISGYSGAGKNTVLRTLEDIGFFCIDNLPIELLDSFFQLLLQSKMPEQRIALGLDVRTMRNIPNFVSNLVQVRARSGFELKIFFVTASPEILIKRFQETRRKHPLANSIDLSQAIEHEHFLLQPLLDISDVILDTGQFNIHELRSFIRRSFAQEAESHIIVSLVSFGFKYGVPAESNFVFDIRSLPNPYFVKNLKSLNGTNELIIEYLFKQKVVQEYWQQLTEFTTYSIKKSHQEGRFFINIAIGCTGGRHRSVAFVHQFVKQSLDNVKFMVKHRDINKDTYTMVD